MDHEVNRRFRQSPHQGSDEVPWSIAHGTTFPASFQKFSDFRECKVSSLMALRGDIVRYDQMRERLMFLREGRRPIQPMGPYMESLLVDVALCRDSVVSVVSNNRHVDMRKVS